MADPKLEDGYTQIANEILEKLVRMHLSPNQWQVLLCIIRKTYGFHKKVDYIANFQIGEATGLGKTVVSRCLGGLGEMELITRKGKFIGFQKDWERWKGLAFQTPLGLAGQSITEVSHTANSTPKVSNTANNEKLAILPIKVSNSAERLAKQLTKVSSSEVTQKIKNTITKDKKYIIPEWIDEKTWEAFLEMRKKKRAIPTERAKELLVRELEKLRAEGHDPTEVLNQSIMRNYTGVFPLKNDIGKRPRGLPKEYTSDE